VTTNSARGFAEKLKVGSSQDILQRTMDPGVIALTMGGHSDPIAEMRTRLARQSASTAQAVTNARAALARLQCALAAVVGAKASNTDK